MRNKRSEVRMKAPEKLDATITYSDKLAHANSGTVSNVSRQGMFLETDTGLSKDSYISMKINTEDMIGKPLRVQGYVVRNDETGVGIRLTYVEYDIMKLLLV
jgi:hypothetical protein